MSYVEKDIDGLTDAEVIASGAEHGYNLLSYKKQYAFLIQVGRLAVIVEKIFRDFLKGMPIPVIHQEVKQMGFQGTGPYVIQKSWIIVSMQD